MKKRNIFVKVFAATMAAVLLLSGCGDPQRVSEKKFSTILEKELGNPPDVVTTMQSLPSATSSEEVWLSDAYKSKVSTGEYAMPSDKYVTENLGERKYNYYGCYVFSKDESAAEQMRQDYGAELEKAGWTRIATEDYLEDNSTYFNNTMLYVKGNNAVCIDPLLGPLHWEEDKVLEKTTEDYYGTFIYFY